MRVINALREHEVINLWMGAQPSSVKGILPTVIEQSGRGDRSFDIYSRLLRERIIFLGTDVNDQVADALVAQLLFLEAEDHELRARPSYSHLRVNSAPDLPKAPPYMLKPPSNRRIRYLSPSLLKSNDLYQVQEY